MAHPIPVNGAPDPPRPRRAVLFLKGLSQAILCYLLALSVAATIFIFSPGEPTNLVSREDRWRFDAMPASQESLLAWARSQPDLQNFHVERVPGDHELILLYDCKQTRGPAHPDWDSLEYRMAYLVSAPRLANEPSLLAIRKKATEPLPFPLNLGLAVGFLAGGGLALLVMRGELRSGVLMIRPADPPQQGWLVPLLVAVLMVAAIGAGLALFQGALHLDRLVDRLLQINPGTSLGAHRMAVVAALVMAVSEELIFRGCVFGRFQAHGYWASGAVLSSALFSVLSGDLTLFPIFFTMGMVLAWLCHRTRSLWPSMALHALTNGVIVLLLVLAAGS